MHTFLAVGWHVGVTALTSDTIIFTEPDHGPQIGIL